MVKVSESTSIGWTDATFNPWWGCERVSPGCAHCYADTLSTRYGHRIWGPGHGFRFFGDKHWEDPLKWARKLPGKLGRRPRVFCASMADVFEERPELDEHRKRLFQIIDCTPELDWLVLTKRPEFARDWLIRRLEFDHGVGTSLMPPQPNVWVGVSIENARYTWRADVLREIPAAVRFISAEPLLGSLFERTLRDVPSDGLSKIPIKRYVKKPLDLSGIDWVIVGGESGPKARPFHLEHAREIIRACRCQRCDGAPGEVQAGCSACGGYGWRTAPFVKQLGARPIDLVHGLGRPGGESDSVVLGLRHRKGEDWDEWPADLRIREFPASRPHGGEALQSTEGMRPSVA